MLGLMITVAIVLFVSAGCSLFEAVFYSVPRRHIEAKAQEGSTNWKVFKDMRSNVEKPISAILSLNTIANTAGAAFAGSAASAVFGADGLPYFSALFTLAILLLSEIIPKTAGVVYSRAIGAFIGYPIKVLVVVMSPFIWLTGMVTHLIARSKAEENVTAEELLIMARLSMRSGGIKAYQEEAIERILTLQEKRVKEVMTPRTVIFSLSEHLTLDEVSLLDTGWEHSRFPVYDESKEDVVGVVLTKEVFMALAAGKGRLHLTQLMRPVHFVAEAAPLNRVLMEFLQLRQHLFVVLDEYGGLSGLITLEDILEEILGREIMDESDQVADKRQLARMRRKVIAAQTPKGTPPSSIGET